MPNQGLWTTGLEGTADRLNAALLQRDTLANRPAAGQAGRLFYATDATEKRFYWDDGAAWVDLGLTVTGGAQTFAGAKTFSGAITISGPSLSVIGATGNTLVVDTNVLVVDATDNIVKLGGTTTRLTSRALGIEANLPGLYLWEADAAVDGRLWDMRVDNGELRGQVVNDAGTVAAPWINVNRSGAAITSVAFPAARLDVNGVTYSWPGAGGSAGQQLQTDGATPQVLSWAAAGSLRKWKNLLEVVTPKEGLATILATPAVHRFTYKEGFGTRDYKTEYVGLLAEEAPWAMHYEGTIVNPVNTLGYMVLGFQAVNQEIEGLKEENKALRQELTALRGG